MNQKHIDRLAQLLRVARPDPRDTPEAWARWADTVKEAAKVAGRHDVQKECKFLRDAGHSA